MKYKTLMYGKELKNYQPSIFECFDFLSKTDFTFLLWLIIFKLHKLQLYGMTARVLCYLQMRAPKTAAYYISPIEIGIL